MLDTLFAWLSRRFSPLRARETGGAPENSGGGSQRATDNAAATAEAAEPRSWEERLNKFIGSVPASSPARGYAQANADWIVEIVRGSSEVNTDRSPEANMESSAGVRAVANIPAVYVPDFVAASLAEEARPYKNAYDLGWVNSDVSSAVAAEATNKEPEAILKRRTFVDRALPVQPSEDIYFCAVEMNGSGIRFYGDVCLVLRQELVDEETVVLTRNSWDLDLPPVVHRMRDGKTFEERQELRRQQARAWAGAWKNDLPSMVALEVLKARGRGERRLTTGQLSGQLLDDEDYMEVLLTKSFGVRDVQEARISSADAALDAQIRDRLQDRPLPPYEALLWRQRRRRAEAVLLRSGVKTRAVTSLGRVKP